MKKENINKVMRLIRVRGTLEQTQALYDLLLARKHTISHKSIPSYKQHCLFVKNHPYRLWYLVALNKKPIGSIYILKDNSLGIFLINSHIKMTKEALDLVTQKHKPLKAIKSLRGENFHVNVNPNNKGLINQLKQYGMAHIQSTYSIVPKAENSA